MGQRKKCWETVGGGARRWACLLEEICEELHGKELAAGVARRTQSELQSTHHRVGRRWRYLDARAHEGRGLLAQVRVRACDERDSDVEQPLRLLTLFTARGGGLEVSGCSPCSGGGGGAGGWRGLRSVLLLSGVGFRAADLRSDRWRRASQSLWRGCLRRATPPRAVSARAMCANAAAQTRGSLFHPDYKKAPHSLVLARVRVWQLWSRSMSASTLRQSMDSIFASPSPTAPRPFPARRS